MESEKAGGISASLARTSPVRRSSSADRRSCRVPGVRLRLLRTDQSDVQLLHDRHGKGNRKDETAGIFVTQKCYLYIITTGCQAAVMGNRNLIYYYFTMRANLYSLYPFAVDV